MQDLRFKMFGFDVTVQPAFMGLLLIYALFSLQRQEPLYALVSWSIVVFVSILVHELGHAFAARRFRRHVHGIFLHGFGGHVTHSGGGAATQDLAISLAGPGAGLALGAATWAISPYVPYHPISATVVNDILWINIFWSLVNLLPMMPLDGGNALRSGLSIKWSRHKATRWSSMVGTAVGALFAVYGFTNGMLFIGLIGGYAAYHNYTVLQQHGGF